MTIKLYPSRLPGEPLEIHEHSETTLHEWMCSNVKGYSERERHPVAAEIDGIAFRLISGQIAQFIPEVMCASILYLLTR